eukprot:gene10832-19648_t
MMDQEEDELFCVDVPATPQPKCDLLNEEKKPARSGKRKAVSRGEFSDLQSKFNSMATELSKVTQTLKAIADIESKQIRLDTGTSAAQYTSLVAQSAAKDILTLPLQRRFKLFPSYENLLQRVTSTLFSILIPANYMGLPQIKFEDDDLTSDPLSDDLKSFAKISCTRKIKKEELSTAYSNAFFDRKNCDFMIVPQMNESIW